MQNEVQVRTAYQATVDELVGVLVGAGIPRGEAEIVRTDGVGAVAEIFGQAASTQVAAEIGRAFGRAEALEDVLEP